MAILGPSPHSPARGGIGRPSRHYADSGEEARRWLGAAAKAAGLHGDVERKAFAAVLSGRDPHTGEPLITAQGPGGHRSGLGAGTPSRTGPSGLALYDEADAATALGVTKAEAAHMFDAGTASPSHTTPVIPLEVVPTVVPAVVLPVVFRRRSRSGSRISCRSSGPTGSRWVTEAEIKACQAARDARWRSLGSKASETLSTRRS